MVILMGILVAIVAIPPEHGDSGENLVIKRGFTLEHGNLMG